MSDDAKILYKLTLLAVTKTTDGIHKRRLPRSAELFCHELMNNFEQELRKAFNDYIDNGELLRELTTMSGRGQQP